MFPPSRYTSEYIHLSRITLSHSIKAISLQRHSPKLDDISSVKSGSWLLDSGRIGNAEDIGGGGGGASYLSTQHFLLGVVLAFSASNEDEVEVKRSASGRSIHQHRDTTIVCSAKRSFDMHSAELSHDLRASLTPEERI
ncbi:hypothetical protein CF319_g7453 [Tilletia indica]|uniref:Uncharacterized protein n=1 Tax=Tilletia indica TaxID=43049 RepID=A0A177T4T2_9BASI|nr:hypothetical protein CF319_g7453 [Tilletia indica]KAE8220422.1 hypothetical protein CF326_g8757 [Tilletia indica]KAE8238736.1 hypothetical protein A4X13_0g8400 [Tilletia indica]